MRSLGEISGLFIYLFFFFMKRFYIQEKHKMQASDIHSDIFIRLKSIKSKQATFTIKSIKCK